MSARPGEVFDVQCPHCTVLSKFPATAVGRNARCPKCGHEFKVPKKGGISARVKAKSLAKESKVVATLFTTALGAFLVMVVVFWRRGDSLNAHYWTLGLIVFSIIMSSRLKEMARIAKSGAQKIMTRCGTVFILLALVCLGYTGKTLYETWRARQEQQRESTPAAERRELADALGDQAAGKAFLAENPGGLVMTTVDDAVHVNMVVWNARATKGLDFPKRMAMARFAAAGYRRAVSASSMEELATFTPGREDEPDLGLVVHR